MDVGASTYLSDKDLRDSLFKGKYVNYLLKYAVSFCFMLKLM